MKQANVFEVKLPDELPPDPVFEAGIRRAPDRGLDLSEAEIALALKNALRYVPKHLHEKLAPEFLAELKTMGRIMVIDTVLRGALSSNR